MKRRSTNTNAARKKYTVDAFEGVQELQDVLSDDEPEQLLEDEESGNDFEAQAQDSFDEDAMSGLDDDQDDEALETNGSVAPRPLAKSRRRDRTIPRKTKFHSGMRQPQSYQFDSSGDRIYTRGQPDRVQSSKASKRLQFYGPAPEDFMPVKQAVSRWERQLTLPRRQNNVGAALLQSLSGRHPYRILESGNATKWWMEEGGKSAFTERQTMDEVDENMASDYMPELNGPSRKVLMGPYADQKLYVLKPGEAMPLRDAWKPEESPTALPISSPPYKTGFLLNLGARVQCIDWAPQCPGPYQFLAVSVLQPRPTDTESSTAFTPQTPHRSNVQIWRFEAVKGSSTLDLRISPKLVHVFCTSWGDIRAVKWCPTSGEESSLQETRRLGLLACLCADGGIRVLNVTLGSTSASSTDRAHHHLVKSVAFESRPPDTVYTCLTWIHGVRIAAGTANGCIAILNLRSSSPTCSNIRPTTYSAISPTYIRAIESGFPSRPDHLFTLDMNGNIHMTDLSQPGTPLFSAASTVEGQRTRHPLEPLVWHDFGQFIVHTDERYHVRGASTRRLWTTLTLARLKSSMTKVAVSPCHPGMLMGTASGDVVAVNPVGRMLVAQKNVPIWQQVWFSHEWRRPTGKEAAANGSSTNAATDGEHGMADVDAPPRSTPTNPQIGPEGLTRFLEGFKVETAYNTGANPRSGRDNSVHFATIYEEESAITTLAWNPNDHVSGWAAAGMGDGLLRVEDIAV